MGVNKWINGEELHDETLIKLVENNFGVKFPEDYKRCIQLYNGGYPEPNCFDMNDGEQGVLINLLSFTNDNLNITMFYDFEEETSIAGLVPIARDPFGNLLCFDYRLKVQSPEIIFYDHEEIGEDAIIPVCSTFTELLNGLYSAE
ncbi:SMI1/KNR4 family protein [Paenibacillus sp. FSL R7-0337]|uniref:SMI1/KNR4 family protein n=1 Tax=Paenibacillus sp. FSL R7-0337 TaxID=1926588 RepID=UPI00096DD557|nr:SMI1/KNR4 family protein [Paenibacillus sp. FSL R7-0337]OMF84180.1 SMI1/KNR4 family protein [Paenibacillus sp. FSL R7-0337]